MEKRVPPLFSFAELVGLRFVSFFLAWLSDWMDGGFMLSL